MIVYAEVLQNGIAVARRTQPINVLAYDERMGQNVDKYFRSGIGLLLKERRARDDNGIIIHSK